MEFLRATVLKMSRCLDCAFVVDGILAAPNHQQRGTALERKTDKCEMVTPAVSHLLIHP